MQWLTGVTLLGQLSTAAAAAQPLQLAAFAARGLPPPPFEGAPVRALLRCIVPPPMTKVHFRRRADCRDFCRHVQSRWHLCSRLFCKCTLLLAGSLSEGAPKPVPR